MPTRVAAVEIVALNVFNRADRTGETITRGMVEARLDELRSHRPACQCGLCGCAAKASADQVYRTARGWQRAIAATPSAGVALKFEKSARSARSRRSAPQMTACARHRATNSVGPV